MKYRIVIAEDEPVIQRYNKRIVERNTEEFEVSALCENGEDVLEYLEENEADVVMTDVRMPAMDGIELIRILKERRPEIVTVVLSGYQDFPYVRECMKLGSEDYLLKPLKDAVVAETLKSLKEKLDRQRLEHLEENFGEFLKKGEMAEGFVRWLEGNGKDYVLVLLRSGCPHVGRLETLLPVGSPHIFELVKGWGMREVVMGEGRYMNERLILLRRGNLKQFCGLLKKRADEMAGKNYYTCIYENLGTDCPGVREKMNLLTKTADEQMVIGRTVIGRPEQLPGRCYTDIDSRQRGMMTALVKGGQWEGLKDVFIELFRTWENEQAPLQWIQSKVMDIITLIHVNMDGKQPDFIKKALEAMEEAYVYARSASDILFNLCDFVTGQVNSRRDYRKDSKELYEDIRDYVYKNISSNIRLRDITERFYISQTYVNRLFNKYAETSFYDFVLEEKILQAKRIYKENPRAKIREMAQMLGFSDAGYFGKVFKARTGETPSDFVRNIGGGHSADGPPPADKPDHT